MPDAGIQAILVLVIVLIAIRFWKQAFALLLAASIALVVLGAETIASALRLSGR